MKFSSAGLEALSDQICTATLGSLRSVGWDLRAFLSKVRLLLFPQKWSFLPLVVNFIVAAASLAGAALTLSQVVKAFAPGRPLAQFNLYLWFSLSLMVFLGAGVVVIYDRLERSDAKAKADQLEASNRASQEIRTGQFGVVIFHEAAELVRECALNPSHGDWTSLSAPLARLLSERLRAYLRARLGANLEFAVTLKKIEGDQLVTVFRDAGQDNRKRPHKESEGRDANYVYNQFKARVHEDSKRKCIVVHDLQATDLPELLRTRARDRGYGTTLAMPLNLPRLNLGTEGQNIGNIVGFFAIDCPEVSAFKDLFSAGDLTKPIGNTGDNQQPKDEMHLLFGLADSIATLIQLCGQRTGEKKA